MSLIRIVTFDSGIPSLSTNGNERTIRSRLIVDNEIVIDNILWVDLAKIAKNVYAKRDFKELNDYRSLFVKDLGNCYLDLVNEKSRKNRLSKRITFLEWKEREINRVIKELGELLSE